MDQFHQFQLPFPEKKKMTPEKKSAVIMIGLGLFMVVGFLRVVSWDKYALSVIPLQIYSMIGAATADDHARYSEICIERKKHDCALEQLTYQTLANPKDIHARLKLGFMQLKLKQTEKAVESLTAYIEGGGIEPRAQFELAKAHASLGNTKEALELYSGLLQGKTDVFQVTVTREYVNTLIKANRWSQAKAAIEKARRKSLTHNAFMTAEYKVVLEKMGGRGIASQ
jgi:thioredoxin-like negative regulator of GroEL